MNALSRPSVIRSIVLLLVITLNADFASAQRDHQIKWVNPDIPNVNGLDHAILASEALGHDVGFVVWTPPDFDRSGKTRYPVIYFLHGAGGSEASDSGGFASRVATAMRRDNFTAAICVFPNGGMSGYRDAVETMIIDELIPLVDQSYPTKAESAGRVITGFSMGGAGAVSLAIRNPNRFCAAGSWGGALSWTGSGANSPLIPAAVKNAETRKENHFEALTINGDRDRPRAFAPLAETLARLGIRHKQITLKDTEHNLGKYYDQAGSTMLDFLGEQLVNHEEPGMEPKARTIRVLTIGNSFAVNACKYLKQISADGGVDVVIGTANLGGCTLERHAKLAQQSTLDPGSKPYSYKTESGVNSKLGLREYLQAQPWDYVTLQQMSALSHQIETYHPHIDQLVEIIRGESPQSRLLVHETWAYRPDSPLLNQWNITQQEMFAGLSAAYSDVGKQFDASIIPVGSAFQRVRSTANRQVIVPDPDFDYNNPVHPNRPKQLNSLVTGWYWSNKDGDQTLKLDFKHANDQGSYLAGLVWYEIITGNDARDITYRPDRVSESDAAFFRHIAHEVVSSDARVLK